MKSESSISFRFCLSFISLGFGELELFLSELGSPELEWIYTGQDPQFEVMVEELEQKNKTAAAKLHNQQRNFINQNSYNSGHKEFKLNRFYFHEGGEVNDEDVITFSEDHSAILFVSKGKGKIVDTNNSTEHTVEFLDSFYCLPGNTFKIRRSTNEDFEIYIATIAD